MVESSRGIKQLLSDPKTATDETFQRNLCKSLRKGAGQTPALRAGSPCEDDLHNEIQAIRKADIAFWDSFAEANKRFANAPLLFFLFA